MFALMRNLYRYLRTKAERKLVLVRSQKVFSLSRCCRLAICNRFKMMAACPCICC